MSSRQFGKTNMIAIGVSLSVIAMIGFALFLRKSNGQDNAKLAQDAQQLLQQRCFGCHNQPGRRAKKRPMERSVMLTDGRIVPGKADQSELYLRLTTKIPLMPPRGGPLPPADIAVIKQWIDAGAPASG